MNSDQKFESISVDLGTLHRGGLETGSLLIMSETVIANLRKRDDEFKKAYPHIHFREAWETRSAIATSSPTTRFSQLSIGGRKGAKIPLKNESGHVSIEILFYQLLLTPEIPDEIRLECMEEWNNHPDKPFRIPLNEDLEYDQYLADIHGGFGWDAFSNYAGKKLVDSISRYGSVFLEEVTKTLSLIERKARGLEAEEQSFLRALEQVTTNQVPLQKEVKEQWLKGRSGRNDDQFRTLRDRLGFKWLPTGTRGKNSHSK